MNNYYTANTNQIEVSVKPIYISSAQEGGGDIFLWRYHVKIINNNPGNIQLIRRYWKIIDEGGETEEIYGEGVVGKQPILAPRAEFEYSSQVYLKNPSGIMGGFYEMRVVQGPVFQVKIPSFSLDMPNSNMVVN